MKVLLVNGSPHEHGCTYTALREAADAIEKHGIETEILWLGKGEIPGCMGCGACAKLGKCVRSDIVNETAAKLGEYDALIAGSPVYYAAPNGQICAFLDRLFYSAGGKLAGKPGAAVVSCRRGGATAAFDRLNKYFTINCMPIVSSNYWNQINSLVELLEPDPRQHARRGEAGRRRAPDDARPRRKHGVAAEVHRGGPQSRSARARGRAENQDELHKIKLRDINSQRRPSGRFFRAVWRDL